MIESISSGGRQSACSATVSSGSGSGGGERQPWIFERGASGSGQPSTIPLVDGGGAHYPVTDSTERSILCANHNPCPSPVRILILGVAIWREERLSVHRPLLNGALTY